jgi:hypothetical protein
MQILLGNLLDQFVKFVPSRALRNRYDNAFVTPYIPPPLNRCFHIEAF